MPAHTSRRSTAVATEIRVHDIQGGTRLSPLAGEHVEDVPGTVTGVRGYGARGFWLQDPAPDDGPAASEGVFVHTGSTTPAVRAGDAVRVSGTVTEYVPRRGRTAASRWPASSYHDPQVLRFRP